MAISLSNYVDYNTARPVQNPLDTGPSVGAMVGQGISELSNTIDEQVQKMNNSKFVIESTKYLNERKLYKEDIQKQILAGTLTFNRPQVSAIHQRGSTISLL